MNFRAPRTWREFREFILQRFCYQNEETIAQRLTGLRWECLLQQLCTQFAAIVAEGTPPPEHELIRLFVTRLPYYLVPTLEQQEFESWVELKDYLFRFTAPNDQWKALWLAGPPEESVREAEQQAPHWLP